jgi:undecaprenyl-diphosphatase
MFPALSLVASLGDKIDAEFFGFDTAIYTAIGALQSGFMTIVAKLFTSFGDAAFVVPAMLLAVVLCFFKRTRKYGFAIVCAVVVGTLITNIVLKPMVLRIRPYNTLQMTDFWQQYSKWYKAAGSLSESDYSFPSGHTTSAFEMAIAVFLCFMSDKKRKIAWIFPVIAALVGVSRIYLMVHYPSDVVAGAVAGTVAGICGFLLAKLGLLIFSKVKFLDNIDAEKIFKKGINTKAAGAVITVALCVFLGLSFGLLMTESEEVKCAYSEEYDCNNKARIDDEDYPAIDGKNYCKIHWKELSGEAEETGEEAPVQSEAPAQTEDRSETTAAEESLQDAA